MEIIIVVFVIAIAWGIFVANVKEKSRVAYQQCLARLKQDPTNANLRQQTLQLGRNYSALTRNGKGVALFDEVALMNDINAATAGAANIVNQQYQQPQYAQPQYQQPQQAVMTAPQPTIEDRLARLDQLKGQGVITEDEYISKRQQILSEI